MSRNQVIAKLEEAQLKKDTGDFRVGDTVKVHIRISEGDKERIQMFTGTVIARKGKGLSETFSVHRYAYGEGMERVFQLHSPRIAKVEVMKKGRVRRGKLYYLRGTSGKASKVKGQVTFKTSSLENNGQNASEIQLENIENQNTEASSESAKA